MTENNAAAENKCRLIAIANQKGGVGKTTTAMNLATALAACGNKVLMIDFDPQGNATTGLGLEKARGKNGSYSLITEDADVKSCISPSTIKNLDLIPTGMDLAGAEAELVVALAREYRLKTALEQITTDYDDIFIDCPPSLGLLTINALVAAKEVIVPMQCEFFAMEGISHLWQTIKIIKRSLNPQLKVLGVLLTMFDKRNRLSGTVEEDVRRHLGAQVMDTVIPRNVKVSEAPSHGQPVLLYDYKCMGSQAYIKLAAEVMKKHNLPTGVAA